jgi:hypothetical protein
MSAVASKNETVSLTDLANASGSDKGTAGHPSPHHYTRIYDMLLQPHRHSLTNMLEIGLMAGGPEVGGDVDRVVRTAPSVDMWLKFFPEAQVRGFDISDFSWVEHPRFTFVRGDSGVASDLEKAAALGPFDLIIDDGSHASFHQQLAFKVLFPKLRPGGLYIIEDLQWQSPYYEDQLPTTHKTSDVIDNWFKTGELPQFSAPELGGLQELGADIAFATVFNQPFSHEAVYPKMAVIHKRLDAAS